MREVLGTQPFLWVLSPIIALGCVTEVQRTQSKKDSVRQY